MHSALSSNSTLHVYSNKGHPSTRLPNELLERILGYIDDKSILRGLASSSGASMKKMISRILYNPLTVLIPSISSVSDVEPTRLELTKDSGYAALFVACFHLVIMDVIGHPNLEKEAEIYWRYVLPKMLNLKRLSFRCYLRPKLALIYSAISHHLSKTQASFSLTHLIWGCEAEDEDAFIAFLTTQPRLVYLNLCGGSMLLDHLPRSAIPALRTLEAAQDVAFNLLKGRNVANLEIHSLGEPFSPVPEFKQALHGLTSLRCLTCRLDEVFEFVELCSNLRYLRLDNTALSDIPEYVDCLNSTKLTYLSVFALDYDDEALVPGLFDEIKSLVVMDVDYDRDMWPSIYQNTRYYRGATETEEVTLQFHDFEPWWHGCKLDTAV